MLRSLAFAPALALGFHAAGCSDDTSSTSSSASSTSSSSGDASSSSSGGGSSSSTGGAGGMGGMAGTGGTGGMGGMAGGGGSGGSSLICEPNTTSACYTGPAGTQGVGLCVEGTWTCNAQGTGYGPCTGEVVPVAENCATPTDENCNGSGPDCGAAVWSKRFGDLDGQYGKSVAADAMGNVYVSGHFYGVLDLGAGPMTATSLDGFLAKFDPAGNLLWSKHFSGTSSQKALAVAVDGMGNVVVAGNFLGSVDFGGGPLTAMDADAFVAKYDASGNHVWSKQFGGADVQSINTVAIDSMNDILVGGSFAGTVDFGGGTMTSTNVDLFGMKLDDNGNHVWSKHFDQQIGSQPALTNVAVDSAGNVAFTGYFFNTVDFGGGPLTSAGSYDVFVGKFGPNGQHLWSKRFGDTSDESPTGFGFDGTGNLFIAGGFKGPLNLGGSTLMSAGDNDCWIAKLDSAGNHQWSKRFGDAQKQYITGIAVTSTGDLALTVTFGGSIDFGGGPLTSAGNLDIAIARMDGAGNHVWSLRAGDGVSQSSEAIAFDPAGHVLLTGELVGSVDFGTGVLTSAGSADLIVAKLAP
ncbi:MAG: nucleotide-binding protein [Polyangiaceae bacterium]|nr:nucleotide-binding protein [Polyangiaceae bacterium]